MQGRDFTSADGLTAPQVVIVNRALAERYFPGRSAVGQRLAEFGPMGTDAEIVGVVDNARYRSLRDEAAPMIYVAHSQFYMPRMTLVVQTTLPPATLQQGVIAAAASIDPELPLFQIRTMPERLKASLAVERLLAWLLSAFAGLAVFLAAAGLYAVVSYTTTLRTREFGIRVALGATARHLRQLVVGQTLWLVGIGLVLGLAVALAASRALGSLLFGVGPTDTVTYLVVGVLLLGVGVAAAQWPARKASRVNPVSALRADCQSHRPSHTVLQPVLVAAAERQLDAAAQDHGVVAGAWLQFLDAVGVDDVRAVDADEATRDRAALPSPTSSRGRDTRRPSRAAARSCPPRPPSRSRRCG